MDRKQIDLAREYIENKFGKLTISENNYIILMSPRSGSNLLCKHLKTIGHGNPEEGYSINPERFAQNNDWHDFNFSDSFAYINRVNQILTANKVLGLKMNYVELQIFQDKAGDLLSGSRIELNEAELLEIFYPHARYILLLRKNKINQAVSFAKALQNGIWRVEQDQDDEYKKYLLPAVYDREHIEGCLEILLANDVAWQDFLRIHEIPFYQLWYEDLVKDFQNKTKEIQTYLGVDDSVGEAEPLLKRIANTKSHQWAEDFVRETPWLQDTLFARALESGDFQAALNRRSFLLFGQKERDRWNAMPSTRNKKLREFLWRVKRKTKEVLNIQ